MQYLGDFTAGDTVQCKFNTLRFSTGAPYTFDSSPTVAVYGQLEDGNVYAAAYPAGTNITVDSNSKTGQHHIAIDTTGRSAGQYQIAISVGAVDGVSWNGRVVGVFSIGLNEVTVTPLSATVSAGEVSANHLIAYQYESKSFVWAITDDNDAAVSLLGDTVKLCLYKRKAPATAVFTVTGSVGGASNNQVTVALTSTQTADATVYEYKLWDTTDDAVLARGTLTVEANPNTT